MAGTAKIRPEQSQEPGVLSESGAMMQEPTHLGHSLWPYQAISRKLDQKWSNRGRNQQCLYGLSMLQVVVFSVTPECQHQSSLVYQYQKLDSVQQYSPSTFPESQRFLRKLQEFAANIMPSLTPCKLYTLRKLRDSSASLPIFPTARVYLSNQKYLLLGVVIYRKLDALGE